MNALPLLLVLSASPPPPVAPPPMNKEPVVKKVEPAKPAAAVTFKEGLSTPESVLYDAEADVYLVSNINGTPFAKDNNGFIAVLPPEGGELTKLVVGGEKGATLNAPKGLGLAGGVLYVADIDTLRMFDRATGAPKGEVKLPGATFANDVAIAADGTIYVSDSAVKAGEKGFEGTGTDAVWAVAKGKAKALVKDKKLGWPNGLLVSEGTLWVANLGNDALWPLELKTKKQGAATKLPQGMLDGVVGLPGGEVLVSSWAASAVYRGKPGGTFTTVIENVAAPADIGFDSKRNRVLVPRFSDNLVEAWALPPAAPPPSN